MSNAVFDHLRQMASTLGPDEKLRLIAELTEQLRKTFQSRALHQGRSTHGILADLGPAPSAEEIDEVRREMWSRSTGK